GEWPLRDEVRIYIRNDVAPLLWDYGVGATAVDSTITDPYAEGELQLSVADVIGAGELLMPRNAAAGPDGRLYVADSGNHRVVVYDGTEAVLSFGEFGVDAGQFNEPWGIAADEEFIYVADTWNHRVQKFTLEGEFVTSFGVSGVADSAQANPGFFFGPRALALLSNNQIAVTDTGNHRIQIFDRDGNFVLAAGGIGTVLGQFYEPVGLAASLSDEDGALFVADTWNQRVQELNADINFLPVNEWPVSAWLSQSIDNKPYLALDTAGRLYLTDPEGYRVLVFGRDGTYIGRFGQFGQDATSFDRPTGITVDAEGNVYVVDTGNGRVVKYVAPFGTTAVETQEDPAPPTDTDNIASPETDTETETDAEPTP
ncbi:MAG: NHL repeat-containing protein, partial [Anaerolineales bacterium]|nr:NHL repeat-containing protein [Anaerolineales bacterium]